MARILYAGKTRDLDAGKTTILSCKGKVMQSDLTIVGAAAVAYNGEIIAAPTAEQTAVLRCADRVMNGDIVIQAPELTLSGTWEFNEFIISWPSASIQQPASFSTAAGTYDGFIVRPLDRIYYGIATPAEVYEFEQEWLDQQHRRVTFDGEQPVTQAFYDWFTANATPV